MKKIGDAEDDALYPDVDDDDRTPGRLKPFPPSPVG
jgi:hypothetical protein